jgi:hypothetical protein
MMIIRKEQLHAFKKFFNEQYAIEVGNNLKKSIPSYLAPFKDEDLRLEIVRLIDLIQKFNIRKKSNIQRIIYLRFIYPSCFKEPLPNETVSHLDYPGRHEDDKTNQLFLTVISQHEI